MEKTFYNIHAGDVVRVSLDPTIGHEKRKERYCLVIQDGATPLDLIIILPITNDNGKRDKFLYVPITNLKKAGLTKPSVIDCYQIRTISKERLRTNKSGNYLFGKVDEEILFEVRKRLACLFDIGVEHTEIL